MSDFIKTLLAEMALILALASIFSLLIEKSKTKYLGLLFGFFCCLVMLFPIEYKPGMIFDTRGTILSLAPIFGGFFTGMLTCIIAISFRLFLGGDGTLIGVVSILLAVIIGLIYKRYFFSEKRTKAYFIHFFVLGLIVHLVTVGLFYFGLPKSVGLNVVTNLGPSFIIINVLFTIILGGLLESYQKNHNNTIILAQTQSKLEGMFNSIPDLVWLKDKEGKYLACNKRFESFFGAPKSHIIGKSDYDFVEKELADFFRANDQKAIEKNGSHVNEELVIFADGHQELLETKKTPILDFQGKLIGVLGIARDITEREELNKRILNSEQRFRIALDSLPEVFVIYDPELRIQFINKATVKLTGRVIEEYIGKTDEELWPPEVFDKYLPSLKKARADKTNQIIETEIKLHNGQIRYLHISSIPILDDKNNIKEILGITHDYTKQKQSEHEILKLKDNLELRVIDRTKQLEKAKKQAEDADKVKSAFLATMSHELRTPLNSIIGFTGVLLQKLPGPLTEEQEKQLLIVKNASKHLLALINDVLDISKVEAGELKLEYQIVELSLLIKRVGNSFQKEAKRRGLDILLSLESNNIKINSDERRIEQILNNLLSNALKFTKAGKITLGLNLQNNFIEVYVCDTGIGIYKNDMGKLFLPFSQIKNRDYLPVEGTGLGLAISKHLIEALGGKIWAESEKNIGSCFCFTIPIR